MLAFAASARAQTATHVVQSASGAFPSSVVLRVPQFDPAIGSLTSMSLQGHVLIQGSLGVESLNAAPTAPHLVYFTVGSTVSGSGTNFSTGGDSPIPLPAFQAYDGTTDYAGASGGQFAFTGQASEQTYLDFPPSKRDLWTGTGTLPITVNIQSYVVSPIQFDPLWSVSPNFLAQAQLTVRYQYTNQPDEFCGGQCPCLQAALVGGCPNSASPTNQGARLTPSSTSSISSDTFTLSATGMPSTTAVAFFQGTTHTAAGAPFGDGLLCVGGTLTRLGIKFAVGGTAQYPGVGDPAISVAGMIPGAGVQRAYQAYYRDATLGFCAADTFNLTNGARTRWQP